LHQASTTLGHLFKTTDTLQTVRERALSRQSDSLTLGTASAGSWPELTGTIPPEPRGRPALDIQMQKDAAANGLPFTPIAPSSLGTPGVYVANSFPLVAFIYRDPL
jgi:hypothetical protein